MISKAQSKFRYNYHTDRDVHPVVLGQMPSEEDYGLNYFERVGQTETLIINNSICVADFRWSHYHNKLNIYSTAVNSKNFKVF